MFPDPGNDWRPKIKRFLLDLDSRIDFAVFQSGKWTREIYERFTAFMDRCHVAGWRRWLLVEPLSEDGDARHRRPLAHAGARPSRVSRDLGRRLAEEIRSRGHLPRPLRQRDRQPRHQAQRFGAARRNARQSDQGGAGDRGSALLRAFRHRLLRHVPRAHDQRAGRRRGAGRLDHHPAARQESVPEQRAHHRAQDQRGVSRALARDAPEQERNPQALSRPRLSGRRRFRRRRGGAISISANRCAT